MDRWLQVRVVGHAMWPTEETKINFGGHELILKPATRDTDQSIHVNLRHISHIEALTLINRFLSVLSWCDDQALENHYGWSGNPVPIAISKAPRATGSSIAFPFYRELESNPRARLALALFREAKSAHSNAYEFLGYFKILNMFWNDRYQGNGQQRKNNLIEGIRSSLTQLSDHRALERLHALKKTNPDVAMYLYQSGRCAIAHAFADPIVDPDDMADNY